MFTITFNGLTKIECLREAVGKLSESELLELWNDYCEEIKDYGNLVYKLDSDEIMYALGSKSARDVIEAVMSSVAYGTLDVNDEYFCVNEAYGHLESFSGLTSYQSPIDIEELVEYIDENNIGFDDEPVEEVLLNWSIFEEEAEETGEYAF